MADLSKKSFLKLTHATLKGLNYFMVQSSMKLSGDNIIRKSRFFIGNYCSIMIQLKSADWFSSRWEYISSQKAGWQFKNGTLSLADWLRRSTVKPLPLFLWKKLDEIWASLLNGSQGPHAKLLYVLDFFFSVIRHKTNLVRKTGGADAAWPTTQNGLGSFLAPGPIWRRHDGSHDHQFLDQIFVPLMGPIQKVAND